MVRHICDRVAVMYVGKIVELTDARSAVRAAAAPVHQGAALGGADPRSRGRAPAPAHDPDRRRAEPGQPAVGLPVPSALPVRPGAVPEKEPPLAEAETGHRVACHFWSEINAAGGARSLPVMPETGAAVVASPFLDEDDGEGQARSVPEQGPERVTRR